MKDSALHGSTEPSGLEPVGNLECSPCSPRWYLEVGGVAETQRREESKRCKNVFETHGYRIGEVAEDLMYKLCHSLKKNRLVLYLTESLP